MKDEEIKKYEDPFDDGSVFHEDTTDYGIKENKEESFIDNPIQGVNQVFNETYKTIKIISILVFILVFIIMGITFVSFLTH